MFFMRYDELIKYLKHTFEIHAITKSSISPKVTDVKLVEGQIQSWEEDVLYVGNTIALEAPANHPIMLCCSNELRDGDLPQDSNYSRISLNEANKIYCLAKDLIFEDIKAENALFPLSQAALDGNNILHLINEAAKILGNALILTDTSMNIIAHSTVFEIMDPLWEKNIRNGQCTDEFKQKVNSCESMKGWSKQDNDTIKIRLADDNQSKLISRIIHNNHLTGGITMIEHHTPISRAHMVQLPLVGAILYKRFVNDLSGSLNKSLHSTILYNLLDELDTAGKNKSIPKIDLPKQLKVVVVRYIYPMYNRHLKRTIMFELERIFPNGYSVQYKGYMAIVVDSINDNQENELKKMVSQNDITIGVSWEFYNIAQFKRYFNQAVSAIKLSHRIGAKNQLVNYTDYAIFDLLSNYAGKIPLQGFCHPHLETLKTYDRINGTEFYMTLRTYFQNNKNLSLTSKALFIHKNSLAYRLNRITQLTGIDLNNVELMHSLIDSFRINEFLNSSLG